MEIIEITNLKTILRGAKVIGRGKTATCFLKNKEVIKIYRDTSKTRELFFKRDLFINIPKMASLDNSSLVLPTKMLLKSGNVIGYVMPYIPNKNIAYLDGLILIKDLLAALPYLEDNLYLLSEKHWYLGDVHRKNIIYNDTYQILDLDFGYQDDEEDSNWLFRINRRNVFIPIIGALFGENLFNDKKSETIRFYDYYLNVAYHKLIEGTSLEQEDFYDQLERKIGKCDLQVRDLKRKKKSLYEKEKSLW